VPFLTSVAGTGTGKYFADENGLPYLLRWDTAWAIPGNAGQSGGATTWQSDIDTYTANRAAQGFNGFLATPTGSAETGNNANGTTWDGVAPFTSPGVLNNTFWLRVDYLLASAAAQGITVVLNALFTYAMNGAAGCIHGWTNTQYQNYGAALGARYGGTPNVVWEVGDDYGSTFLAGQIYDAQYDAFLTGLRGGGGNQLISIECASEGTSRYSDDGTLSFTWGQANAQWDWCYAYGVPYNSIEKAYGEAAAHSVPSLCVCRMDGWYDAEGTALTEATALFGRKNIWWSLSSGSRGYMYGNNDIYTWPANIIANGTTSNTPGAQYVQPLAMKAMFDTFAGFRSWHQLIPDTASALVTAGRGTKATDTVNSLNAFQQYTGGNTYVTASKTADSTMAVIYIPSNVTITVNGGLMAPGYSAKWVDPANGAITTATIASTYNNPAANSAGDHDWVLTLSVPPYATWAVP